MRMLSLPLLAMLLLPSLARSQTDWQSRLQKDLVTIQGGKMVLDHYRLDKIQFPDIDPVNLQVKLHAEAPVVGLISRDNFVAHSITFGTMIMFLSYSEAYGVTMSQFLEAYDSEDLDAPIGTPNTEVNIIMTTAGVQFEIVNNLTGQRIRTIQSWEDLLGEGTSRR
jgi:hypothetical protein